MPEKRIITQDRDFPIKPEHIDASDHLFDSFDNMETEISAGWIVRFMQERRQGWAPFTYEEINSFYAKKFKDGFTFNRLVHAGQKVLNAAQVFMGAVPETVPAGGGWIVEGDDKKYYVTDDFVTRCFRSRPSKSKANLQPV